MSYGRMKKVEPELAAEVARWVAETVAIDAREDEECGVDRRGDELADWVANKQKRLERPSEGAAGSFDPYLAKYSRRAARHGRIFLPQIRVKREVSSTE